MALNTERSMYSGLRFYRYIHKTRDRYTLIADSGDPIENEVMERYAKDSRFEYRDSGSAELSGSSSDLARVIVAIKKAKRNSNSQ